MVFGDGPVLRYGPGYFRDAVVKKIQLFTGADTNLDERDVIGAVRERLVDHQFKDAVDETFAAVYLQRPIEQLVRACADSLHVTILPNDLDAVRGIQTSLAEKLHAPPNQDPFARREFAYKLTDKIRLVRFHDKVHRSLLSLGLPYTKEQTRDVDAHYKNTPEQLKSGLPAEQEARKIASRFEAATREERRTSLFLQAVLTYAEQRSGGQSLVLTPNEESRLRTCFSELAEGKKTGLDLIALAKQQAKVLLADRDEASTRAASRFGENRGHHALDLARPVVHGVAPSVLAAAARAIRLDTSHALRKTLRKTLSHDDLRIQTGHLPISAPLRDLRNGNANLLNSVITHKTASSSHLTASSRT